MKEIPLNKVLVSGRRYQKLRGMRHTHTEQMYKEKAALGDVRGAPLFTTRPLDGTSLHTRPGSLEGAADNCQLTALGAIYKGPESAAGDYVVRSAALSQLCTTAPGRVI